MLCIVASIVLIALGEVLSVVAFGDEHEPYVVLDKDDALENAR